MKHNYIGRIAAGNLLEDNASVAGCIPYNDRAAHRLHNKPPHQLASISVKNSNH
jgi:hypothetical protein